MPDDVFKKLPKFGKINFGTAKKDFVWLAFTLPVFPNQPWKILSRRSEQITFATTSRPIRESICDLEWKQNPDKAWEFDTNENFLN